MLRLILDRGEKLTRIPNFFFQDTNKDRQVVLSESVRNGLSHRNGNPVCDALDLNTPHYIKRKLSLGLLIQEKSSKPFEFNYQKKKTMKFWTSAALISVIATATFAQGPFPIFGGAGGPVPVGLGGPVGGFGGGHPAFGGGPFGGGIPVFGGGAGGGFGGGAGGGFGGPSGGIPFSGPISSFGPPPQFGSGGGFGGPSGFSSGGPSGYGGGGSSGGYTLQGLGPSSEGGFGGL
ncbi:hypothetical protein TNCV_3962281 [Trichonephila clavipes]|nr:hypothetical protein TNCV_3962281 [Trichonephila clavipes]